MNPFQYNIRSWLLSDSFPTHGLDPERSLQRLFDISCHFVSFPPSLHKTNAAKAPATARFGAIHGLAVGSCEKEWWWTQPGANPSLFEFRDKQGKYRER
jgi:hypothetical protein